MEYRRFGDKILVRMDRGDDFFEKLKKVAVLEDVKLGTVGGLGTFSSMTVGAYNLEKKQFEGNDLEGFFEVVSLTGTIDTMNGEYYSHIHAAAADRTGKVYGGHLSKAVIAAVGEFVITVIDGEVDREKDEETGLNVFKFV